MANVYYKFNSEINFSNVGFDGLHISVGDLKKAILHQKRLGKTADFDLLISNAQTKEEYVEENCLIPKNTSLIVARVPVIINQYSKRWEQQAPVLTHSTVIEQSLGSAENVDLSKMNGSEEDKINAMMVQSTLDYDPSSYQRVRGSTQVGEVPASYRCHRCHKTGHWIKNCPSNPPIKDHYHKVRPESKKMTGIPRSLRENPPANKVEPTEVQKVEEKREPPEDLLCTICKGIVRDAVMIPCCGSSFCDECIRTALLESDDNECPECNEKGTPPGSLIPNRFLRTNVAAFLNETNSTGNGREKFPVENVEENSNRHVEASPQIDDHKETENDTPKREISPQQAPAPVAAVEPDEKHESHASDDDEDDYEDNITVTVPPASHQCGPVFRDTSHRSSHRSKEMHERERERHSRVEEPTQEREEPHHKSGQYAESYYYEEPYNDQQQQKQQPQHSSYNEEPDKNYMAIQQPASGQNQYPPQNMYNQHAPGSQMPPMRPQFGQYQGQPHQAPFYPHQQNVRPYRYDHHNYPPMRHHHHHHHGPHQQYPMHQGHGNYGMRFQRPDHIANAVAQNIQQRFGPGVIEDPLEAFNKIMREKEMRKDRRRSPARFNEGRTRSPVRKYSPDRYKSPQRRRKRTRSFSSHSSPSRSRSRSDDRHHERDYRNKKHRVSDRNKSSDRTRTRHRNKSHDRSPDTRKVNNDHSSNTSALQEIKPTEDLQSVQASQEELISNQPPPPGDEEKVEETKIESNAEVSRGDEEIRSGDERKAPKEKSVEKSVSSEDAKRSKKIRDKKKHKKSDTKGKKKKKRERKEKRSVSRSVTEDESIVAKNADVTDDEKGILKDSKESPKDDTETSPSTTIPFDKTATSSEHEADEFKPELSKWEKDESQIEKHDEEIEVKRKLSKESTSDDATVTTEILKRAENVLFSKSSSIRLNKDRDKSSERSKESSPLPSAIKKSDEKKPDTYHVTIPVDSGNRSVELKSSKSGKSEPARTSIKERLGKKVTERSKSRSRTPERKHHNMNNNNKSSRHDSRKHLSSTIGSVKLPSKSDTRSKEPTRRRSRSYDRRDYGTKKHQRSKTRSSSRGRDRGNQRIERRDHRDRSREKEQPRQSKVELKPQRKDQKLKRRSDSLRSDDGNERKKMRSSSVESKKHKKKKKKEKKAKKKSRDRK